MHRARMDIRFEVTPWEGANEPLEASHRSSVDHPANQLRAPYIFLEGGDAYLVYAAAGESGIAIARLDIDEAPTN